MLHVSTEWAQIIEEKNPINKITADEVMSSPIFYLATEFLVPFKLLIQQICEASITHI